VADTTPSFSIKLENPIPSAFREATAFKNIIKINPEMFIQSNSSNLRIAAALVEAHGWEGGIK